MADPGKGRIAIKFGSTISTSKRSRPNPPSSLGKRPRSNAWGHGSDSEPDSEDDDGRRGGRHETITGFGADGAETAMKRKDEKVKKEYIIAPQGNRDWKFEVKARRRGKNLLPEEERAKRNGTAVETEPADQDKGIQWGLTVTARPKAEGDERSESTADQASQSTPQENGTSKPPPITRTADEEAISALLGTGPQKPQVTIASEEDAYLRDVKTAGEDPTLADYEAIPVEEFGAALLRGQGWDGETDEGPKLKEVRRRPNRLGLGAKELKEDEDLGGWNQGGKKNRKPRLNDYRREEEKKKEGRRHEDSYKSERDREKSGRDSHRHGERPRDSDRDYERRRDRHRDNDRDRRR